MPKVLAIDCEMCETVDPVDGSKRSSLIRLSIVDAASHETHIIDELVVPDNPISDPRTFVHGISKESMMDAEWTFRVAQAELLKIITDETILIGHSISNDLKAMKLSHE